MFAKPNVYIFGHHIPMFEIKILTSDIRTESTRVIIKLRALISENRSIRRLMSDTPMVTDNIARSARNRRVLFVNDDVAESQMKYPRIRKYRRERRGGSARTAYTRLNTFNRSKHDIFDPYPFAAGMWTLCVRVYSSDNELDELLLYVTKTRSGPQMYWRGRIMSLVSGRRRRPPRDIRTHLASALKRSIRNRIPGNGLEQCTNGRNVQFQKWIFRFHFQNTVEITVKTLNDSGKEVIVPSRASNALFRKRSNRNNFSDVRVHAFAYRYSLTTCESQVNYQAHPLENKTLVGDSCENFRVNFSIFIFFFSILNDTCATID